MPSFLSKLFRRKDKEPDVVSTSTSKGSKKSRKSSKKKEKRDQKNPLKSSAAVSDVVKPSNTKQEDLRRPSLGTSNYSSSSEAHARVLSPRGGVNNNAATDHREPTEPVLHTMSKGSPHHRHSAEKDKQHNKQWNAGPVDLDNSDLGSDTDENNLHSRNLKPANLHGNPSQQRLSVQQLHRFDMQQQKREATQQFYMPTEEPRFSAGHVPVADDGNRSDASSSSFNLSTDAEDTEYEALRKGGVVPTMSNALDSSNLSGVSSPTNYNTDGDNSIFPALQTDDEGTTTERESQPESILPAKAPTTSEDESDRNQSDKRKVQKRQNLSASEDDEEEDRAWAISPNKNGANPFPFHHNPTSPQPRRNFTSPKIARSPNSFTTSALSTSANDTSNEFANFADFSNVTFPADNESWGVHASKANKIGMDSSPPPVSPSTKKRGHRSSSSAAEMTLSDILAQAKGKRGSSGSQRSTGSRDGRRISSSSVNSAPAITAKYLRQHHNLRPTRHSHDPQDGTTPVSDIIDSLEVANASRSSHHSGGGERKSRSSSHSRTGDRLRQDRRNDPSHTTDTSEGSDQEGSETWLFDEVTGALGPRGIAADLESLSGRSKSSSGNKSHKSHKSHRSHRSHGRSRRRKSSSKSHHHPSSGESVDSRGSRHSRSSRYSHRSTRSYLSQMSEQSRSVANDLLRLEMQLAMVGSQDNNGAAVQNSSASVASRASRKSRSSSRRSVAVARRNKVTIQAPPGKLGIILANKADSKGTVVSGVRSSSVLSEKISPGDRIVAIDGEDVSLMTVSEITTIMARKSDFERTLTVLTTPKHMSLPGGTSSTPASPPHAPKDYHRYGGSGR